MGEGSTNQSMPVLFQVEVSSLCKNSVLIGQGSVHSGSVSWDDGGWVFPDKLLVSLFPDTVPGLRHSPLRLHLIKGVCVFRCNLPPALLAEWLGSFIYHCGTTRDEYQLHQSLYLSLDPCILVLTDTMSLTPWDWHVWEESTINLWVWV